jgi:8-oxo-dGTP diphosphatase
MKNLIKVVECAIEHQNNFLIIKRPEGVHAGGLLSFPGGKVEQIDMQNQWDVLREAVKREIFEEVGLQIQDYLSYVMSNYFVDSHGNHVIDTIFYCKIDKTELKISTSDREVAEYYWLSESQINQAKDAPSWLKQYIYHIQEQKSQKQISA